MAGPALRWPNDSAGAGMFTLPSTVNVPPDLAKSPLPAAIARIWKLLKLTLLIAVILLVVDMVTVMAVVVHVKELIVSVLLPPLVTVGPAAGLNSNPAGRVTTIVLFA